MGSDPDFERPTPKASPKRRPRLIELLVVVGILGLLVALLLPATRSSRGAARRLQCLSNLRQISLALHGYESKYGALPPSRTVDASGRPLHSWRTLILPFLDQDELYRSIDLAKPWNDEANARAYATIPSVFRCPASLSNPNSTTYLAVVGPNACFLPDRPRPLAEITNDHASTLMLIEAGPESAVHWMEPRDADEALVLGIGPNSTLDHNGGINSVFVDGSSEFLSASMPDVELRKMIAISGREPKTVEPAQPSGKAD